MNHGTRWIYVNLYPIPILHALFPNLLCSWMFNISKLLRTNKQCFNRLVELDGLWNDIANIYEREPITAAQFQSDVVHRTYERLTRSGSQPVNKEQAVWTGSGVPTISKIARMCQIRTQLKRWAANKKGACQTSGNKKRWKTNITTEHDEQDNAKFNFRRVSQLMFRWSMFWQVPTSVCRSLHQRVRLC